MLRENKTENLNKAFPLGLKKTRPSRKFSLNIGEYAVSNTPGEAIRIHALGSCIALIFLDPKMKAVGMVHVAMADSTTNRARARKSPGVFADTAIPALIEEMSTLGCTGQGRGWIVKLVGGSQIADRNNTFCIGKRTALAIKKALKKYNMCVIAEDLGGDFSRTVTVEAANGRIEITSPDLGSWLL